jgi:hypothetical protein
MTGEPVTSRNLSNRLLRFSKQPNIFFLYNIL